MRQEDTSHYLGIRSSSSGQSLPLIRKIDEWRRQLSILLAKRRSSFSDLASFLKNQFSEYNEIAVKFGAEDLQRMTVFEIGCGQRPYRIANLLAHGVNVRGVDMDAVVVKLSAKLAYDCLRTNGFERAAKTIVRYFLIDRLENQHLRDLLQIPDAGFFYELKSRIVQGSAADEESWPNEKMDFIYSEDVFEHITPAELSRVCELIAYHLSENGFALIRPMIFTGIQGGHNVEWYNTSQDVARSCPPWDHLRNNEFPANTYLNKMWLSDYRKVFSNHLEIIEETIECPEAGRWALTPDIQIDLSQFPMEELFLNRVRFILRRKRQSK